jgi:CarD family transcriptional regulator
MYEIGQQVLYGIHGICTVTAIERMRFGKEKAKYYCLEPVDQPGAKFYVPVENAAAVAKLRRLLSREELLELLHSEEVRNYPWIADENQRKLRFRELIGSGDRLELMGMICALHRHRKEQLSAGRKFHQSDENFLNDAQKLLNAEFAQVFGLEPKNVNAFILKELENTH